MVTVEDLERRESMPSGAAEATARSLPTSTASAAHILGDSWARDDRRYLVVKVRRRAWYLWWLIGKLLREIQVLEKLIAQLNEEEIPAPAPVAKAPATRWADCDCDECLQRQASASSSGRC